MHLLPKLAALTIVFSAPRYRSCAKFCLSTLVLLIVLVGNSLAQQLTPFVVSSSGGFYSNSSGMLSFTTGEMAAVETFTSPSVILTQGFQQAFDIGTYITEHPDPRFSFGLYPNPTTGYFNLITETETIGTLIVDVVDVFGRVILQKEMPQQDFINVEPFDLTHVAPGMYVLAITFQENGATHGNQCVAKIQVIR